MSFNKERQSLGINNIGGVVKKFIKQFAYITIFLTIINVALISDINSGNISVAKATVSTGTVISLTNSARSSAGLSSLSSNSQLAAAAAAKAADMFQNQYFAHTSPQGKDPWYFINNAGYDFIYAGENLAIGYSDSAEVHSAWMNSPTHRANILNPNYREIGVAQVSGEYEGAQTTIVVQEFGSMSASQPVSERENIEEKTDTSGAGDSNQINSKTFTIVSDKTGFSPQKAFVGDEITYNIVITGEATDVTVNIKDEKITLSNPVKADNQSAYSVKQKILQSGELSVSVTVVDKWGNRETKELGKLITTPKVFVKSASISNDKSAGSYMTFANIVIVLSVLAVMTFGVFLFLIFRHEKKLKLI